MATRPPPPGAGSPPRGGDHDDGYEVSEPYSSADDGFDDDVADGGALFGAIVLLEVSYVEPDYLRPWQKSPQGSCTGTGFAVPDDEEGGEGGRRRLLTNLHVVQDATDIRVRKHGHSRRWRARVVAMAADVDLAVLQIVSDDSEEIGDFWSGVTPVSWVVGADERNSGLPLLQSPVSAVGYPTGGRTICVTEGVVSRIDCRNYRLKTSEAAPGKILVIQVDSAINPGNSGGPCFDSEGKVVGVAFQGLDGKEAQNVGYIIPACVALNFLHAIGNVGGDGTDEGDGGKSHCAYGGVQEIPFKWANLQNKSLRKFLKFDGNSGVVVKWVSPLAAKAHGEDGAFLKTNDVITHIDGKELGEDYTVGLRLDELMNADFLITGKRQGERTTFNIVRDTKPLVVEATLSPLVPNCPRDHGIDCTPEWLVLGGLLFVPLTCPLLTYGTDADLQASGYLAIYDYMDEELRKFRQDDGHHEIVILIDILKSDVNFGYDFNQRWRKLDTLNGRKVENMAELYNMYIDACQSMDGDSPTEFLEFVFRGKSRIVLETKECTASEKEVLDQHGIPEAVSPGISERAAREREQAKKVAS